jgi:hypothetical protein
MGEPGRQPDADKELRRTVEPIGQKLQDDAVGQKHHAESDAQQRNALGLPGRFHGHLLSCSCIHFNAAALIESRLMQLHLYARCDLHEK